MILQTKILIATTGLIICQLVFPSVFATSPVPASTESQESEAISSLIANANLTIDDAIQAVQDNNSTEALSLLSELRSDMADINGNVTNLIFSVAAQPP